MVIELILRSLVAARNLAADGAGADPVRLVG